MLDQDYLRYKKYKKKYKQLYNENDYHNIMIGGGKKTEIKDLGSGVILAIDTNSRKELKLLVPGDNQSSGIVQNVTPDGHYYIAYKIIELRITDDKLMVTHTGTKSNCTTDTLFPINRYKEIPELESDDMLKSAVVKQLITNWKEELDPHN